MLQVKNQTVKIAQQLQQQTEEHDKEIMEIRLTAVANTVKETVKKSKAQNPKRKKAEENDINEISSNKYLQ